MQKTKVYKLAYLVSHPIQYQSPMLKLIADQADIDLHVFFLGGNNKEGRFDAGFGTHFKWDVPLTEGYKHTFLDSSETDAHYSWLNPRVRMKSLKDALLSQPWDAVWFHGYNNLALIQGMWICRRNQTPIFFRGESNLLSTRQSALKDRFIRWLVKSTNTLLWISSDNRDYYRHYGATEDQLIFSPYAVDNNFFQRYRCKQDTTGLVTFLFASKFIPRKNAPLLVEAYAQLSIASQQASRLWLIGDGEEKEIVEQLINKHGLEDKVELLGFKNQTELPEYLNQCDVFVLPSRVEPFGLIVNEAMNLGKAIITTDEVGAARDLIQQEHNGWIIKANDREQLTDALESAIRNSKHLQSMGARSLERINEWSFQQIINGLRQALRKL